VYKDGKIYHPHLIHACPFAPLRQELAKGSRSLWDSRCLGSGIGAMDAHKELIQSNCGASFVLLANTGAMASGPYVARVFVIMDQA